MLVEVVDREETIVQPELVFHKVLHRLLSASIIFPVQIASHLDIFVFVLIVVMCLLAVNHLFIFLLTALLLFAITTNILSIISPIHTFLSQLALPLLTTLTPTLLRLPSLRLRKSNLRLFARSLDNPLRLLPNLLSRKPSRMDLLQAQHLLLTDDLSALALLASI